MDWQQINFDWNYMRAFIASAQCGSFSAAAKELAISQTTLGRQVSALESQLKVTLFERVGSGLKITESGQQILNQAHAMAECAQHISLIASGLNKEIAGHVIITASEVEAIALLPKAVKKIQQSYPDITLEVKVTNEVSDLQQREADIAIRGFRPKQPELIAKKLGTDRVWAYGTKEYLAQFEGLTIAHAMQKIRLFAYHADYKTWDYLNNRGWTLSESNFPISSQSLTFHDKLVKQGLGLGFYQSSIAKHDPELIKAFPDLGPINEANELWLVTHRELRTSAKVRAIFDLLADFFTEQLMAD